MVARSKLESRFARFLAVLRKIYGNDPFFEALKEAPLYLKVLSELISKKDKSEEVQMVPMGELWGEVLQSKSLSKL